MDSETANAVTSSRDKEAVHRAAQSVVSITSIGHGKVGLNLQNTPMYSS
jgi:hypothetical protein